MIKKIIRNLGATLLFLAISSVLSFLFFHLGNKSSANIALFYILALILIALNTDGYIYGICASVFCVAAVNVFFTYPFFRMDFTLDGYPITFLGMLAVSIITSTTTTRIKKQKVILDEKERKLAETEKERIRANLLRAVSHDLRTPLTTIIGSSASCLEDYDDLTDQEKRELIHNIHEDAGWLLNMVENLLTVTRIQDDSGKVKKSPEVVEEVISEAITRTRKRNPKIKICVNMPEDFLIVPMDATLIEQVLINLMENACVHSHTEKPLELTVTNERDYVSFKIRDYGIGLDEMQLPYIFEGKYTRSAADSYRGVGIGLSICKTIITAHSGTITAANHENGAEFTFTLPKERDHEYDA